MPIEMRHSAVPEFRRHDSPRGDGTLSQNFEPIESRNESLAAPLSARVFQAVVLGSGSSTEYGLPMNFQEIVVGPEAMRQGKARPFKFAKAPMQNVVFA
jgi:hypothetical protein